MSLLVRFGKIEGIKVLPQRYPNTSLAAFIDFQHERSAKDAQDARIEINGCEIRTNYKSRMRGDGLRQDRDQEEARSRDSPERPKKTRRNDR